jgi:hypothetical protein
MLIETSKLMLLFLVYGSYLVVSMPGYIFWSVYQACQHDFNYDESYLCYMVLLSMGACYCFAEMIAYNTPFAHIYVMSAFYLLTCCIMGAALSLMALDKEVIPTVKAIPEATGHFLKTGLSLHFKYAGNEALSDAYAEPTP